MEGAGGSKKEMVAHGRSWWLIEGAGGPGCPEPALGTARDGPPALGPDLACAGRDRG